MATLFTMESEVGTALRRRNGMNFNLKTFLSYDADKSGALSKNEFVSRYWADREKSAESFQAADADSDGQLTLQELAYGELLWHHNLSEFQRFDSNSDARLAASELSERARTWQISLMPFLVPAFDLDGDGLLSPSEFSGTPLGSQAADWFARPVDSDADGRLSLAEFHPNSSLPGLGVSSMFFKRFDRDSDGALSAKEIPFHAELSTVGGKSAFALLDFNRDTTLSLEELGKRVLVQKAPRQERLRHVFRWADGNSDQKLSQTEFNRAEIVLRALLSPSGFPKLTDIGRLTNDEIIQLLDGNRDGKLSLAELFPPAPSGNVGTHILDPARQRLFEDLDSDGDGFLAPTDHQELVSIAFASEAERWLHDAAVPAYASLDVNHDGELSLAESSSGPALTLVNRHDHGFYDFDGNGSLSLREYCAVYGQSNRTRRAGIPDLVFEKYQAILKDAKTQGRELSTQQVTALLSTHFLTAGNPDPTRRDANGNGKLSHHELRLAVGVLLAIRGEDGSRLRYENGQVFNRRSFSQYDADHDQRLSRQEFLQSQSEAREKSAGVFDAADSDRNGWLTLKELARNPNGPFWVDNVGQFNRFDVDHDCYISPKELKQKLSPWQYDARRNDVKGFDANGDGRLSFKEFTDTPLACHSSEWHVLPDDKDRDGGLSFEEYYTSGSTVGLGLASLFFRRLDTDGNLHLAATEAPFRRDILQLSAQEAFAAIDRDVNQSVSTAELYEYQRSPSESSRQREELMMKIEDAFRQVDRNNDGNLPASEFEVGSGMLLTAMTGKKLPDTRKTASAGRLAPSPTSGWSDTIFIGAHVVLAGGVAFALWWRLQKSAAV